MKKIKNTLLLFFFACSGLYAQETVTTSGATVKNESGNKTYTVGQVFYTNLASQRGSVSSGVQQSYTVTDITSNRSEKLKVDLSVYPNPTTDQLTLKLVEETASKLSYQLFDMTGRLLEKGEINSLSTTVNLRNRKTGTFILSIIDKNSVVKSLKIVKK